MSLTVGTNTYITEAEADALLAPHPRRGAWGCRSQAERELALLLAARQVDLQPFRGRVADTEQALAWPRAGVVDAEGRCVDSETVPDRVKLAQAELALHVLAEDFDADDEVPRNVERVRAGNVELEFRTPAADELPSTVREVLRPLLDASNSLRMQP